MTERLMKRHTQRADSLSHPVDPRDIYLINYESAEIRLKSKISLRHNLLSFLMKGRKSVHYSEEGIEIGNTQFLLMSSGNCLMSEKTAGADGYQSVLFFFDNKILGDFFVKHPLVLHHDKKSVTEVPFLVFEKDDFLQNYIQSLLLMLSSGQQVSRDMLKIKLEELLLFMSGKYPAQIARLQNSLLEFDDLSIKKAVSASVMSNVTVEELAFLCNTSLSTFKRKFSKLYGTSPNKWLLNERMKLAADLLKRGHLTSEIYSQVGYENLSSFIYSFKQIYGVTPKQFQVKH